MGIPENARCAFICAWRFLLDFVPKLLALRNNAVLKSGGFVLFPEELGDRTFRIFVQRTCHLLKKNLALSKPEEQLVLLLKAFPELGFLHQKKEININTQYAEDELNPFSFLAAVWQVQQQLTHDSPKGYRNVVQNFFDPDDIAVEDLATLAGIYDYLYKRTREKGGDFTETDYLYEVQYLLQNFDESGPFEEDVVHADNYDDKDLGLITPDMIGDLIGDYMHLLHEEESTKPVAIQSGLSTLLNKMPVTWVNAISDFWQLPEARLKRDRIKNVVALLTDPSTANSIFEVLAAKEKEVLSILEKNDGYVKYNVLSKKFGGEENDGYWWEEKPPESTIGRLRLMGLIAVGKAQIGTRRFKTVFIPRDVRPVVQQSLKN